MARLGASSVKALSGASRKGVLSRALSFRDRVPLLDKYENKQWQNSWAGFIDGVILRRKLHRFGAADANLQAGNKCALRPIAESGLVKFPRRGCHDQGSSGNGTRADERAGFFHHESFRGWDVLDDAIARAAAG